ncbi:Uncharacterised protein [Serratia ficaria]|uniref:hypothetical protein n=1 Tax=Serratia ficaria TaxID=61651 RepID=UPI002183AFEA|nr:hypothetical protein [Serratia ficaria]CAI2516029.1 Uncharacterised protein [Serratia ficaria]
MNKLSELSKPVAWPNGCNETAVKALRYLAEHKRPIGGSDMYNTEHLYMIAGELMRMASHPFYSQEYVSTLQQRIVDLEGQLQSGFTPEALAQEERAEDAEQRVAELEAIATDYAGKFQKAQDAAKHLIIMNDSAQAEIAHLKALLATPVRLPKRWDVSGQVNPPRIVQVQFEQQNRTHDQCAEAIRSAGFTFTVEGDE